MRRVLTAAIVVGLLFPGSSAAIAHHRPGPCDTHWHAAWVNHRDVEPIKRLIRVCAGRYGVSKRRAIAVASCETGGSFYPTTTSSSGTYRGIYQHSRFYWPGRVDQFTRARWRLYDGIYNARTQAVVTMRMVARYGWGAWGGCLG